MAGARIEVDDADVLAALNRLTAAGGRLAPAFREVGETLLQSTEQRFQQQRAPAGTPWAPLSPKYQKRKDAKRRGGPDLILVLNGYLESQMRYQADDEELLFGTDRLYGAVHQFGWPERNIPARPYLGVSESDRSEILEILNEHLVGAIPG